VERYLNNSGTPTVVIIPKDVYFTVMSPSEYNELDAKVYNYRNDRILFSEKPVPGWEKSKGVFVVPRGLRLLQYNLEGYVSPEGELDEESIRKILDTIYKKEKGERYKIYWITDDWDGRFC
ncbi:hypothetical protein GQ472_04375, partial [archaeon]|nr:hypothetical protein [archaeon]